MDQVASLRADALPELDADDVAGRVTDLVAHLGVVARADRGGELVGVDDR